VNAINQLIEIRIEQRLSTRQIDTALGDARRAEVVGYTLDNVLCLREGQIALVTELTEAVAAGIVAGIDDVEIYNTERVFHDDPPKKSEF
jgi:hypothetical protein